MHPVLTLPLLGVDVRAYTLFTVLGALAFAAVALPLLKRTGLGPLRALRLLIAMAAAFLAGARLWNVAVNPGTYRGAMKWYSFRLTGFSLYGGVAGAALVLAVWARWSKTRLLPVLDAVTAPAAAAFALARVGCFLTGCCGGVPTHAAWGVEFPAKSGAQELMHSVLPGLGFAVKQHPTQLYELSLALLGLAPALLIGRRFRDGSVFLIYCVWFSAFRLAILPLRALPYSGVIQSAVYPALYITLIVSGFAALARVNRHREVDS